MKKILLASAAVLALSLPATAQQQDTQQPSRQQTPAEMERPQAQQPQQPSQMEQQGRPSRSEQAQTQPINPSDLSKDEVTQLQEALDQKGFDVKKVDGIWGPNTEAALKKFQQENNLGGDGQPTEETMAELGLGGGPSGTTGAGQRQMRDRDQQPPAERGPSQRDQDREPAPSGQKGGQQQRY